MGISLALLAVGAAMVAPQDARALSALAPAHALAAPYPDTSDTAWYVAGSYIDYVTSRGLMAGYADTGRFGPEDTVTRAQVCAVILRWADPSDQSTKVPSEYGTVTNFTDVLTGRWYTSAVEYCRAIGVVTGDRDASGNLPGTCKYNDTAQYILCGSILDDSGEWIDLESLYNINGHKGEVVVFHFDKDEGGKLLREMYYTQRLKLSGRSWDMDDLTVTFDDGTTLTLKEYDEYIGRQIEWVESLPPITPEDGPLYEWWVHRHDRHSEKPQGPSGGQDMHCDENGCPKAAAVGKDSSLFV